MMDDDEYIVDGVERYTPSDTIPDNKIPVKRSFDELSCIRCVLAPQEEGFKPQTYIAFLNIGGEDEYNGKEIMRITGAKQVNLWYRLSGDGSALTACEDLYMLRSLEQILVMYEEEKKARMQ